MSPDRKVLMKTLEAPFERHRITTLAAVMFCYLFYYTGRQSFGFAIPGIEKELGFTKEQLGWCSAALLWAYAAGQAINGQLADRFGGKRMMALGACLSFGFNVILSFMTSLPGIMLAWGANGLAQSMGWAPGSRILSNWWSKSHRGRVYGWYVFAAGCSSVVTYATSNFVLEWDLGWRWIFRLPVVLMLLGAIVFWLVAKERPSDVGHANLPAETPDDAPAISGGNESAWHRYRVGLTCVPFMIGCFSIGFQNLARYGLLVWVPVHFLGSKLEDAPSPWLALGLPLGMAIGAVSAGWLSDRVFGGKRSTAIILFLLLAAASTYAIYLLPGNSPFLLPLLFLAGFFVYGPQAGYWALCPDLLGAKHAGTGTGIMNFFAYLFAGLGEPLIGSIIDHTSTSAMFTVVAVACVNAAVLMCFVRR
ncbi:MAG: MFS transporter [Verrucomicrobiota bacterium]